jgi:hypothetical protein
VKATQKARSWQYKYPCLESDGTPFRQQPARRIFVAQLPPTGLSVLPFTQSKRATASRHVGRRLAPVAGYSGTGPAPPRAQQDVRAPPSYWPSLDFFPLLSLSFCSPAWHPWGQGSVGRRRGVRERERERGKGI